MAVESPISFLDLPPELRIQIYKDLFWTYFGIPIHFQLPKSNNDSSNDKQNTAETRRPHAAVPYKYYAMNLFLTNKQVYLEAAHVFYSHSIFRASIKLGEKDWQTLYKWLVMVGPHNRKNLRRMEISYCCLEWAPMLDDGQPGRRWVTDLRGQDVYQPLDWEYLSPTGEWVEYISPTIEKIFKLLGECRNVIVTIDCCANELGDRVLCPELYVTEQGTGYPNSRWFDMSFHSWYTLYLSCKEQPDIDFDVDLYGKYHFAGPPDKSLIPDLVELYRTRYGEDSISVLWTGEIMIRATEERSWRINMTERSGWDILQSECLSSRSNSSTSTTEVVTMQLKRRSKNLHELAARSTGGLEDDLDLCMWCSDDAD
ncbi:hypothetical protein CNMCM6936_005310 [Aspergillus lentulus]|nr:hypothetical protein CNMCM6936_005310 [Aspergillus lentulus]KAF4179060.1 hypothetical protein CNMCM8060_003820 [Aspergillus lentulus]KAF4188609.1 hypothetical protein CNMCM7927_001304 [Aspergillus lentulus]KAF4191351.1 hypothetical protein CNMCM8694_002008 [Aspergillus lentulus]